MYKYRAKCRSNLSAEEITSVFKMASDSKPQMALIEEFKKSDSQADLTSFCVEDLGNGPFWKRRQKRAAP